MNDAKLCETKGLKCCVTVRKKEKILWHKVHGLKIQVFKDIICDCENKC